MPEIDWNALGKELGDRALEGLKGILEGAKEDLKEWGVAIGRDMVRAVRDGRDHIIDELKAQAKLLAEMNRISAINHVWEVFGDVLASLVRVTRVALLAGGVSL